MIKTNIHQTKTHLSEYLEKVAQGEHVVICKRNIPIAEIIPISAQIDSARPIGLAKSVFKVPESFFDPLPEEEINLFYGEKS